MKRGLGLAVIACLGLILRANAATETIAPSNTWPQARSDIPSDPDIVFGTLPNGMRYLIKKNANPAHGVSLRLRIAAGSLEETDSQRGLAHFLEHMAFRGSKHLPDGQAIKMLESVGVSLQADLNAQTYPDSTVFEFDLPANDDATLDKGLFLTREIASNLSLNPKAIASERKVVLAEIHQKDTASLHMSEAYLTAALGPQLAEGMIPLGNAAVVQSATAAQLRKFYLTYYRPERTTLVVVGDVDPKAVEAIIKARFSNWKDAAPQPKPSIYAIPDPLATPVFKTFSEPGASATIQLTWATPFDTVPDTVARTQRDIVRNIALTVLNLRLQKLAQSDKPPFIAAAARYSPSFAAADISSVDVSYGSGNVLDALRAAHDAYADVLTNGVRQDEVSEAVAQWRTLYQALVTASNTLPDKTLSSMYLIGIGLGKVIDSPEEASVLFEGTVKDLNAQEVNAALRSLFAGSPSVFVSSPTPVAGGETALAGAFSAPPTTGSTVATASTSATASPTALMPKWPYTNFGAESAVSSQKSIADLGVTMVTFANGVRATIKSMKSLAGQVDIVVRFGGGRLSFSENHKSPSWALPGSFVAGGLKDITLADMQKVLAGTEWNAALNVADDAFELRGQTRTSDFDTELQVLAAYMTDPAWRPEAFAQVQSAVVNALNQTKATPDGMFGLHLWSILHDNDARWQPPSSSDVRATHPEDVKALLQNALANGPVEVVVVGDITVGDAVKGLQATFGELPKRRMLTAPAVGDENLPAPQSRPIVLKYQGGGHQAVAMIGWPTTGMFPDTRALASQLVLKRVLAQRLFDTLRTQEGVTYTPQAQTDNSTATASYGFLDVYANVPDTAIPNFYAAVATTVAELKSKEIGADELDRARSPLVNDLEHARQNNAYWLSHLDDAQIDSRRIDLMRSDLTDLQQVTAADVLHAAQTYLSDDKAWKVIVIPKGYSLPVALQ